MARSAELVPTPCTNFRAIDGLTEAVVQVLLACLTVTADTVAVLNRVRSQVVDVLTAAVCADVWIRCRWAERVVLLLRWQAV